jgi:hypothetical protein
MTKRTSKENYSIKKMVEKLETEGYNNQLYDKDRAEAAAMDMYRRGTLPIVTPPTLTANQNQQKKAMTEENRQVTRRDSLARRRRDKMLRQKLQKLRRRRK